MVQRFGRPIVDVDTAGAEDARALLEALGHGVSQHTVRFVAQRWSTLRMVGAQVAATLVPMVAVIAMMVRLRLHGPAMFLFLVAPLLLPMLLPLRNTMRIEVGADGFVVRPIVGRARFVRYADVRDVREEGSKVVIVLRDADDVVLHFASYLVHAAIGDPKKSFLARVREAREAHEGHRADTEAAALVARGDRSAEEWASALRALGERATTRYRVAEVRDEALFRILEDPSADAASRGGAAAALRARVDADGKTRLRVAVDATAAPNVRSALARIVDAEDDEAVVDALASIEARR